MKIRGNRCRNATFGSAKRGEFWKDWRWWAGVLGSLGVAMILMGVLIVACVVGTVAESRFDTGVARAYIYDAPWFVTWLLLLCINLIAAVLTRYPWKPHQIGFIITHAGIVVLLAGAMVGKIWGVEGNVTLRKGEGAVDYLTRNERVVSVTEVEAGETRREKKVDLHTDPVFKGKKETDQLNGIRVSLVGASKTLGRRTIARPALDGGAPAVKIRLSSQMVPHRIERWLILGRPGQNGIRFGPGEIEFLDGAAKPAFTPKEGTLAKVDEATQESENKELSRERHFVFAEMPEMGMSRVIEGSPSGMKARLGSKGGNGKGRLQIRMDEHEFTFAVDEIVGREVELTGTPWKLENIEYYPDFRMKSGEAISISQEPNNPALRFVVAGRTGHADHEECDHPEGECDVGHSCCSEHGGKEAPHAGRADSLKIKIYYRDKGVLEMVSHSNGGRVTSESVRPGMQVETGLGDWELSIEKVLAKAVTKTELYPMTAGIGQGRSLGPGVKVKLRNADNAKAGWLPFGRPQTWQVGNRKLGLRFGFERHPLDFAVKLEDFEVSRNEGTRSPSGFKSSVRFIDESKGGASSFRQIWMNHPATYPDFVGAGFLGTSYKFSQASWNPDDLSQTTLQVLRDPGWSLKWIGSLLVCLGIFTIFYIKPYPQIRKLLEQ